MAYTQIVKHLLYSKVGFFAVLGLLCVLCPLNYIALIGVVLLFTTFDIFGYREFGIHVPYPNLDDTYRLVIFRMLQAFYGISLLVFLYTAFGLKEVIAALVLWFALVCDVLYYFIDGDKLVPFDYFYKAPTIVAFYKYILKKNAAPVWAVLTSAVIGTIGAFYLIIN